MAEMTRRERLMTALRGRVPDRVPCAPNLTRWVRYHAGSASPIQMLRAAREFDLDLCIQYAAYTWESISNDYVYAPCGGHPGATWGAYGDLPDVDVEIRVENRPDHVWYHRTFHTPAGELRDVIQWARPNVGYGDGPNPHRAKPLIETPRDLEALAYLYPPPRPDLPADLPVLIDLIGEEALVVACDCTHVGCWGLEPLGPEGMLIASVEDADLFREVCRLAQRAHLRNLRAMLERRIEVVYDSWFQCGPSVGWSPRAYDDFFLPLVKESIDLTHGFGALYVYQDDGKMRDIIPHLVEAGADAISGLQPPDVGDAVLKDIKAQYGDRVALLGGLDPCYTFDMGGPDEVREAVRQAIADAGPGGGYIVGTGEAPAPEASRECFHAVARAAKDFGVYGRDL